MIFESFHSFSHCWIPMILYTIIGSSLKPSRLIYLGPSVSMQIMQQKQYPIFISCPIGFVNIWVKMIIPPLTALFPMSSWDLSRNSSPILRTILIDKLSDQIIFILGPGALRSFSPRIFRWGIPLLKIFGIRILKYRGWKHDNSLDYNDDIKIYRL